MPKPGQKMYWTIGWAASKERREFQEYQQAGGGLGFNAWLRQGKPRPPTKLGAYGAGILPPREGAMVAEATPADIFAQREREKRLKVEAATKPLVGEEDAFEKAEREKREWERERWEREFGLKEREFGLKEREMGGEITPWQQAQLDLWGRQEEQRGREREEDVAWRRELAQMQQQEQERQYRTQLMANPMSWLQYSSYTGQTPVVQEWMKPLMSQQYQTGQELPGWMGKQGEGQAMGSLPELRTPSAQLWGRMGPTAQAQYMGYGQARTGIRPEETMFRLGATAPPSGRFGGLRRMR